MTEARTEQTNLRENGYILVQKDSLIGRVSLIIFSLMAIVRIYSSSIIHIYIHSVVEIIGRLKDVFGRIIHIPIDTSFNSMAELLLPHPLHHF